MSQFKTCKDCLKTLSTSDFYKHSKYVGKYQPRCKTCTKRKSKKWASENSLRCNELKTSWRRHNPFKDRLRCLKSNAKRHGRDFSITLEYLESLWTGKCAISGIDLDFNRGRGVGVASVDRIDNAKGYIEGNIQWVCDIENNRKGDK